MKLARLSILLVILSFQQAAQAWGFYSHKLINRVAVFSLPPEMFGFYKANIEYLTEHAVDADKRRYSDSLEAPRHYLDLDHYEAMLPVDTVPRFWKDAVTKFSEDTLRAYGIVTWHINVMYYRLVEAMKNKDKERILKLSADIGHYFADAHVPLHASVNYNGQLTNQHGIHGFWESRLPELYSDDYDLFVGKADYIHNVQNAAWQATEGSFAALDSVLVFERNLNSKFDSDKKYSYEQKGAIQVRVYSKDYSARYTKMLDGQVERRMRASITAVADIWYTAWVDAGQPDLNALLDKAPEKMKDEDRKQKVEEEQKMLSEQRMIGRQE
jgi:hypothetical protein